MTRPRGVLLAALTVALLLAAACGGGAAQKRAIERRYQRLAAAAGQAAAAAPAAAPGETAAAAGSATPEAAAAPGASVPAAVAASGPGVAASAAAPKAGVTSAKAGPTSASPGASSAGPAQPTPGQAASGQPGTAAPVPGATATASDVGVTASSIKLGHIGIYSGPVGSFGENLSYACRAGLQSVNDAGGVNGRKYDVLVRDDGWDATKGSNAVRDLVERQKVFALACSQSVPTNDAITPYMDQQKTPNVGSDGWGEAQYAGAWSFPVGASGVNEAQNLAEYQAKQQAAKRVGVLYWNNTTGKAYLDAYKKIIEQNGGAVVVSQAANFDDPGTSTFIAQARADNVDTITTMVDPGIFARMVREAASQGFKPKNGYSGGAALYFQATPGLTGPTAEGTITSIDWLPDDPQGPAASSPGYRDYKQTVEHYYPQVDHSNWTKAGFIGARVLTDSLKRLGLNVTRQGVKDDLDRVSDFDTGLGSRIGWRPGQHRSNKTSYLAQLKQDNGKLVWKYLAGPIVR